MQNFFVYFSLFEEIFSSAAIKKIHIMNFKILSTITKKLANLEKIIDTFEIFAFLFNFRILCVQSTKDQIQAVKHLSSLLTRVFHPCLSINRFEIYWVLPRILSQLDYKKVCLMISVYTCIKEMPLPVRCKINFISIITL